MTHLHHPLEQDTISLKVAGVASVVIGVIIIVAVFVSMLFDGVRREKVIEAYTHEAEQLISENSGPLTMLFTTTRASCQAELAVRNAQKTDPTDPDFTTIECQAARNTLNSLNQDNWKDFSSTVFVYDAGDHFESIEASGQYNQRFTFSSYQRSADHNPANDAATFMRLHQPINQWQDFSYVLTGKEVLLPVAIDGKIMGFMLRGVIDS